MTMPKYHITKSLSSNTSKGSSSSNSRKLKGFVGELQTRILEVISEEPFITVSEIRKLDQFSTYQKYSSIKFAVFGLLRRGFIEQLANESLKITTSGIKYLKTVPAESIESSEAEPKKAAE